MLKRAKKVMYKCISKERRLSARCPVSLRALLFRTYVLPILTYAGEVIPYTRKHMNSMNTLIIKYARWATCLPSSTCTNAVLREAGLRPVQYDLLQARMNYYLLLTSREDAHVTKLALVDMQNRSSTSAYNKWIQGIVASFENLSCRQLLSAPSASANKSWIDISILSYSARCTTLSSTVLSLSIANGDLNTINAAVIWSYSSA